LGGLHYSFCPSVSVEFFENRGDVKFDGVEGNPQPTRNCFVGDTIRHRREHFKFAGRQLRIPVIAMGKAAGYRRRELERQGSLTRSALACQSLRSNDIE
jgi:hypothetical protein